MLDFYILFLIIITIALFAFQKEQLGNAQQKIKDSALIELASYIKKHFESFLNAHHFKLACEESIKARGAAYCVYEKTSVQLYFQYAPLEGSCICIGDSNAVAKYEPHDGESWKYVAEFISDVLKIPVNRDAMMEVAGKDHLSPLVLADPYFSEDAKLLHRYYEQIEMVLIQERSKE